MMPNDFRLPIGKKDGIKEFDQHISAVQQSRATLKVPKSIEFAGALGRSVAFAQFVATWAATDATPKIETYIPTGTSDDLERFVSRLHGLTAAYYADLVMADDGETNLKMELLKAARPRISAMRQRQYAQTARGKMAEFIFVNGARSEFHSAAYRRPPTMPDLMDPERHGQLIVSARELNALAHNVIKAQNITRSDDYRIVAMLGSDWPLGHLLHETFRNTAEHAYLEQGRIPEKGLRCILISAPSITPEAIQPRVLLSADHPQAADYFEEIRVRAGRDRRNLIHMLEISVLDTGPGFAKTIGQAADGNDDVERVKNCFLNHVSSKTGTNSGLGLGRVLSHVDSLEGYLRIRTSTTEVFFSSRSPLDESLMTPNVAGGLPDIVGTALTIAIPLSL